jgi:putative oxidoreductase
MTGMVEPLLPYVGILALIIRVWMGANMVIHGRPQLGEGMAKSIKYFKEIGVPEIAVKMGVYLEVFGGIFLVIGLIVPIVALLFVIYMAAISVVKKTKMHAQYVVVGKPSYEIDVLYVMLALVLLVLGAGALSLDGAIGI